MTRTHAETRGALYECGLAGLLIHEFPEYILVEVRAGNLEDARAMNGANHPINKTLQGLVGQGPHWFDESEPEKPRQMFFLLSTRMAITARLLEVVSETLVECSTDRENGRVDRRILAALRHQSHLRCAAWLINEMSFRDAGRHCRFDAEDTEFMFIRPMRECVSLDGLDVGIVTRDDYEAIQYLTDMGLKPFETHDEPLELYVMLKSGDASCLMTQELTYGPLAAQFDRFEHLAAVMHEALKFYEDRRH